MNAAQVNAIAMAVMVNEEALSTKILNKATRKEALKAFQLSDEEREAISNISAETEREFIQALNTLMEQGKEGGASSTKEK